MSHPTWVRGLKLAWSKYLDENYQSHPTWVRGLKHFVIMTTSAPSMSHPTWVRGLKHREFRHSGTGYFVAPYVGAWIETW